MKKCELDLFSTPISVYDLSKIDVKLLLKNIFSQKSYEHFLVPNGQSSYGTENNILNSDELKFLKEKIQECICDYCIRIGIHKVTISNSWFNITKPGGKLNIHRHEGSVVSGAFYPKINNPVTPLRLKSPLLPYKMNELYEHVETKYATTHNEIEPSQGMLILFPSWVEHETNQEISERITVSFNSFYET